MSLQGRSLDDLPLAAYSTGVAPTDDEELDPAGTPSVAAAPAAAIERDPNLGPAVATGGVATAAVAAAPRARFRLPFQLPRLGRANPAALAQAAPFQPVGHPIERPVAFQAVSHPIERPGTFQAVSHPIERPGTFQPVHRPADVPPPAAPPARLGRSPRAMLRDRRVIAGGAVVVGLALLGISLLGGGPGSGSNGPTGSQDTAAVPSTGPGNATVELTGDTAVTFSLTSATGAGPAANSQLNATWTDPAGESLGIVGLASQGVRTTDANFVLSWTMLYGNLPVTFTSKASECTIGMAVGPRTVHGTFICKKLKSDDGRHVVDLHGDYTT